MLSSTVDFVGMCVGVRERERECRRGNLDLVMNCFQLSECYLREVALKNTDDKCSTH